MKLCQEGYSGDDFQVKIYETGWLKLIARVMEGAYQVAATIEAGESVLTHCSDGWDRTAQLTSISMIMLDPYYRTFDGFLCLIEKEWMSFGHQFHLRLGFSTDFQNESPVFIQFLECVNNLLKYYPVLFEFNEQLLVAIIDQLYNGCFGTFMYNTEAARVVDNEYEKTISLWAYLLMKRETFINSWFVPSEGCELMKIESRHLTIWDAVFQRWDHTVMNAVNFQRNMKTMLVEKQKEEAQKLMGPKSPRLDSKRTLGGMRHVQSSPTLNAEGETPEIQIRLTRGDSTKRNFIPDPIPLKSSGSSSPRGETNISSARSESNLSARGESSRTAKPLPIPNKSVDSPRRDDSSNSLNLSARSANNNNGEHSDDADGVEKRRESAPTSQGKEEKSKGQKKQRDTVQ
jgi:hypothetical protein